MAENKTKPTELSVPAFIDGIADAVRQADAKALASLMQKASGEKPKMWGPSIIGFGSLHYKYESGREGDMPIVSFSPRKAALVLYGLSAVAKLGKYSMGKGCLYIKKLADVDQEVLSTMVSHAVTSKRKK